MKFPEEGTMVGAETIKNNNSFYTETSSSMKGGYDIMTNLLDIFNVHLSTKSGKVSYSKFGIHNEDDNNVTATEPAHLRFTYSDIPTSILMNIFSYLDVISLCRAAQTCERWSDIANDNLLWEKKLKQDSHKWEVIDHLTHPDLHIETNPELQNKEIYLKCCPECRLKRKYEIRGKRQLPHLGFYFGFSIPKVIMFGSGLDNSGFVKSLLWDKRSPFTVKEMFPGQFEGMGSGFTLQYSGGLLNLITLYGMSKAEREAQLNQENGRRSRFLVNEEQKGEEEGDESSGYVTLSQSVRELCSTVDAFIYVVNSSDKTKAICGRDELKVMLDSRWVKPTVPLLVLCLVPDASTKSVASLEVANELQLLSLSRPWQVRQCHMSTFYGLQPGLNWFTNRIMSF